jgi:hypothetical protein
MGGESGVSGGASGVQAASAAMHRSVANSSASHRVVRFMCDLLCYIQNVRRVFSLAETIIAQAKKRVNRFASISSNSAFFGKNVEKCGVQC